MREFEIERDDSYTVITNNILRNKDLSNGAKGLLCTMLALPPEWDYSFNGLVAICKEGKNAIRSQINELKDAKYIKISQYRNDKGYYQYKYTVYRKPCLEADLNDNYPTPGNRTTDIPVTDNRTSENLPQINTNKIINNKIKDKYDKELEITNLNNLVKLLISKNYIDEDDSSIFSYNELFNDLLEHGNSYKDLIKYTNYIVDKVKLNNYSDEDGNSIKNRFGYFKNSIISTIDKFNYEYKETNYGDNYFDYDWLNDDGMEI